MKKISKNPQPAPLQKWWADNAAAPQNLKYNEGGFPREAVLNGLINEQGLLCAYTQKRISAGTSHVEHLKPQDQCLAEDQVRAANGQASAHEDVDWRNMVACFPGPNVPSPDYGAHKKANWWSNTQFVSPLAQNCEQRFRYLPDGSVAPMNPVDSPARETIERLNLNSPRLKELRLTAILGAGVHPKSQKPISSTAKIHALLQFWNQRRADQSFAEFCVVLTQAAQIHLNWLSTQRQKRAFARRK
jgi:uncharacterized protein (TIGR02646 family)